MNGGRGQREWLGEDGKAISGGGIGGDGGRAGGGGVTMVVMVPEGV
ncbi:hypothetical protein Acr_24g0015420 [Actinidia rufa]|uniref:Uncharacterized protein n=1 Tax=Actinidia rufa TaxID=165716 RepID=A0A7J0GX43_9ERIC|nr:hypothetical protein Acr_24g0015420 [Actinidia rufa]